MRAGKNKAAVRIPTQDAAADWSMTGKTVLFTGASRGMGRFAAIELARLGAQILLVGHNQARGAAAAEAIRGTGGSAEFLPADMGDAAEVRALATAVLARNGPVHVLIHSAGGMPSAGARTREGVDRDFAQNFLGAFLLTRLLEERLLASAPARVIAVGSGAHRLLILMSHVIPFFVAAGMEKGSQQYVCLAADPALASVSGRYFVSGKEKKQASSPLALDPAVQERIGDAAEAWAAPFLSGR